MNGLTLIILDSDERRAEGAVMMAMAHAALAPDAKIDDYRTRIFFHAPAVALLKAPVMPMIEEALAMGVEMIACQSGLGESGLTIDALATGVTTGGPVQLFTTLGQDRLVML